MTVGVVRPLHELEADWKTEAKPMRLFGEIVAETCLCGGVISSRNTDPAIAAAVGLHNSSTAHAQWAIREGWR